MTARELARKIYGITHRRINRSLKIHDMEIELGRFEDQIRLDEHFMACVNSECKRLAYLKKHVEEQA